MREYFFLSYIVLLFSLLLFSYPLIIFLFSLLLMSHIFLLYPILSPLFSLLFSLILIFSFILLFLYSFILIFSLLFCGSPLPSLILSFSYPLILHYHSLLFSYSYGWMEGRRRRNWRKEGRKWVRYSTTCFPDWLMLLNGWYILILSRGKYIVLHLTHFLPSLLHSYLSFNFSSPSLHPSIRIWE